MLILKTSLLYKVHGEVAVTIMQLLTFDDAFLSTLISFNVTCFKHQFMMILSYQRCIADGQDVGYIGAVFVTSRVSISKT